MTRVAFLLPDDGTAWLGGLNYLINLLGAVADLPGRTIETVLLASPRASDALLARFRADAVVRTPLVERRHPMRIAGKLTERATGGNVLLDRLFRREGIAVLSHYPVPGARFGFPVLSWIPDFQERHIPDFFTPEQRAARAASHRTETRLAQRVILSSEHARGDLIATIPDAVPRARVLRFVAGLGGEGAAPGTLAAEYGLDAPFFYLPNQFWVHKNHRLVVDALALLRARGRDVTVICTGNTADFRRPEYFGELTAHVEAAGVGDLFRVLGIVPYPHVAALLRECAAVINPSLFEGWSTTVEEAKTHGKRILLSDIPVHREQAPDHGDYFAVDDAERLANLMSATLDANDPADEARRVAAARSALPGRRHAFAETYQSIVRDAVTGQQRGTMAA